jgi:hypothetical protein
MATTGYRDTRLERVFRCSVLEIMLEIYLENSAMSTEFSRIGGAPRRPFIQLFLDNR